MLSPCATAYRLFTTRSSRGFRGVEAGGWVGRWLTVGADPLGGKGSESGADGTRTHDPLLAKQVL